MRQKELAKKKEKLFDREMQNIYSKQLEDIEQINFK